MDHSPSGSSGAPNGAADDVGVDALLELESLDADSLFTALTGVEKDVLPLFVKCGSMDGRSPASVEAVPELLLCVKPILAHLSTAPSDPGSHSALSEEESGLRTRDSVERYVDLLDKIQYVLRQTIFYLRHTRVPSTTLRPPKSLPTPFAARLPGPSTDQLPSGIAGDGAVDEDGEVELGLYASRIEARTLKDMAATLRALQAAARGAGAVDGDMPIDPVEQPPDTG